MSARGLTIVIVSVVLALVTTLVVGVVLVVKLRAAHPIATASPTGSPSPVPRNKMRVYLSPWPAGTGWEQPYGGADRVVPAKVERAIVGAVPSDKTIDVQTYKSNGVGTTDQMLLAAVGDYNDPSGGQLNADNLNAVLAAVQKDTGLTVTGLQLQPKAKQLNVGCAAATWGSTTGALCGWFDGKSLGFGFFYGEKPQDVAPTFPTLIWQTVSSIAIPRDR